MAIETHGLNTPSKNARNIGVPCVNRMRRTWSRSSIKKSSVGRRLRWIRDLHHGIKPLPVRASRPTVPKNR
ncbi:hypothetical protein ANDA3_0265 [plant metagenome]|uniref:Uncharacterized protein n=1 Tax=plant metagenome TaxID=1297885 RepID=A0A484STJ7_9ZZZZ